MFSARAEPAKPTAVAIAATDRMKLVDMVDGVAIIWPKPISYPAQGSFPVDCYSDNAWLVTFLRRRPAQDWGAS
ncbi:hypothetical protein CWO90_11335 [Bradyrhizobium sp. Leo121]|nr:hypothetical protein CWO90_11335 [Bradyrhizobium sp. Leo121]